MSQDLVRPVPGSTAMPHCQIPCGIYNDPVRFALLEEHVATIEAAGGRQLVLRLRLATAAQVDYLQPALEQRLDDIRADSDTAHITASPVCQSPVSSKTIIAVEIGALGIGLFCQRVKHVFFLDEPFRNHDVAQGGINVFLKGQGMIEISR